MNTEDINIPFDKRPISINLKGSLEEKKDRDLFILFEMGNFLSGAIGRKDLLAGALSRILKIFDLKAGRIYLAGPSRKFLYLAAYSGMMPNGLEKVNLHGSFTGRSFLTKSLIAYPVTQLRDKKRANLLLRKGFKFILCIPLINRGKVKGVMNLASDRIIDLDRRKIELITVLGNQIAVTTDNIKLYEELNRKLDILTQKKEMIKFFAYSVSHDLKGPAIGIYGLTKRLKEKYSQNLDKKGMRYCDQIMNTARHMIALLEKINDYISAKEMVMFFEKIRVKEIMQAIRLEFIDILVMRRIKWSEPKILPEIIADRIALTRVFRNLVDNALKYGGDKMHEIKIGYEETSKSHVFSVSDDGVVIKKENQEKIFKIFEREETSLGKAGSGLGLAIVNEIAKKHQGRAWVSNGQGNGKSFFISLSKSLELIPHNMDTV